MSTNLTIRVAIHGAAGRMGRRLVALGHADEQIEVVGALEHAEHSQLGVDAGELAGLRTIDLPLTSSFDAPADVVIDFSVAKAVPSILSVCLERNVPLVVATTGLEESTQRELRAASGQIPIVWAPNMSLAVNLVMKLAQLAAQALKDHPSGVDVEILERHHRYKEDAPSGTALRFGEIIAEAMGQTSHTHGREGRPGARPRDEIAYHAIRTGDNPGEHTIVFGMLGETIELGVGATSRDSYALGALAAARWLVGKPAGLYDMNDVLGL